METTSFSRSDLLNVNAERKSVELGIASQQL